VVGNAVPVTIIRVIYKHLGVSIPPRSNTLSKRQKSPPATLHSGSLNPPVAQIKLVSQRVCCMPLGFIPRILWQAWLPRCISILLSPTGADVNFVALWIRYMFSIACATFLQRPPLDPNKAVNSWVFLGAVVGCRKFMLEYASLFFKDLVWLVDCVAARNSQSSSKLRTCSVASTLLRATAGNVSLAPPPIVPPKGSSFCYLRPA